MHFLGWLVEEGVETHKNLSVCTRPMAKGKTNSCLCAASAGDLGLPVVIGLIWINLLLGLPMPPHLWSCCCAFSKALPKITGKRTNKKEETNINIARSQQCLYSLQHNKQPTEINHTQTSHQTLGQFSHSIPHTNCRVGRPAAWAMGTTAASAAVLLCWFCFRVTCFGAKITFYCL